MEKSKKHLRAVIDEIVKTNHAKSLIEVNYLVKLVYPDVTDYHIRRVWTKYNDNPYTIPVYLGSKTEPYYEKEWEIERALNLKYSYEDVKDEI